MNSNSKYFKLFASCIPIKGGVRSVMYDLQRNDFKFIPNGLFEIIDEFEGSTIENVLEHFTSEEEREIIKQYFDFLIKNEFIFFCDKDELELFPKLDFYFDFPGIISNAIVDIDERYVESYLGLFAHLESLGCLDVVIRFPDDTSFKVVHQVCSALKKSTIKSVDLYLNHSEYSYKTKELVQEFPRVRTITILNSDREEMVMGEFGRGNVLETTTKFEDLDTCYAIDKSMLTSNIKLFMESQFHHSYLNKKIYVSKTGEIKNSPETKEVYGNILKMNSFKDLKQVVESDEFQKYWNITKDETEICCDCEFRYMCIDSRVPSMGDQEKWKHDIKCNYDPYSASWLE